MTSYDIRPGVGVGPVRLGATRSETRAAIENAGLEVRPIRRWPTPEVLCAGDSSFQVFFDDQDHVAGIELYAPANDSRAAGDEPPFDAVLQGVDVFRTTATELTALVSAVAALDTGDPEYPKTYAYPSLGISFWRSGKPNDHNEKDTPYFESVLITPPRSNPKQ